MNTEIDKMMPTSIIARVYNKRREYRTLYMVRVMHLSIVCPTTPCAGRGGGKRGDLLDLTLKTRPRGGAIDTPFVSTEPSIWHAF